MKEWRTAPAPMMWPCRIICGDEGTWWNTTGIDPTVAASAAWLETHPLATAGDKMREGGSIATVGTDRGNSKRDRLRSEPGPNYETNPITSFQRTQTRRRFSFKRPRWHEPTRPDAPGKETTPPW